MFLISIYKNLKGFDFESTSSLLKTGVTRIGGMMNTGKGNRKLMFYMIIILTVGFILLYKIISVVRS